MPDFANLLGARKSDSTLLVLFIPSRDRTDQPIDQDYWVRETLGVLGELFGGATAFPRGQGVWRDDAQSGLLTSLWLSSATPAKSAWKAVSMN